MKILRMHRIRENWGLTELFLYCKLCCYNVWTSRQARHGLSSLSAGSIYIYRDVSAWTACSTLFHLQGQTWGGGVCVRNPHPAPTPLFKVMMFANIKGGCCLCVCHFAYTCVWFELEVILVLPYSQRLSLPLFVTEIKYKAVMFYT